MKKLNKFSRLITSKHGLTCGDTRFNKIHNHESSRFMKVNSISDEQVQMGQDHALIGYLIELDYGWQSHEIRLPSAWVKENGQ